MKKLLKTGKKALSVFMAVMMVMTAWVFVAPTGASAADEVTEEGKYYVRVYMRIYDGSDGFPNKYSVNASTGLPDADEPNMAGFTLFHKADNGKGSEEYEIYDLNTDLTANQNERSNIESDTWAEDSFTSTKYTLKEYGFNNVGFPTKLCWVLDDNNVPVFGDASSIAFSKITIAASSDATEYVLWKGLSGGETTNKTKKGTVSIDGTSVNPSDDYSKNETKGGTWEYPYADDIVWNPTSISSKVCPTGNNTVEIPVSVSATDQYGVKMFNPTWAISSNKNSSKGLSLLKTSASDSNTINISSAANIPSGTDNSQTVTVKATWDGAGTDVTDELTFTLTDARYTVTFEYMTQTDTYTAKKTTETKSGYHGATLTAPTVAQTYSHNDEDFNFTGWSPAVPASLTVGDIKYIAQYSDPIFVSADYTDVEAAKAAVQQAKNDLGLERFTAKYTTASQAALEKAISNSDLDYPLGRTKQDRVKDYATAILNALNALEPNTFNVIFLDNNGAILKYEKGAEFEASVAAPEFPAEQKTYYDAENHYTYTGWDSNEYTSVADDLVIAPVYVAEAHDWKIEDVQSTCVEAGTKKYTCNVCGFVKYDGGDELGDHVWEADYTVDIEPTCTVAGSKSIHCSLCDAQKDITTIEPLGHNFTSQSVAVEATCGKIGIMTKLCDDCMFCEHTIIPALEHDLEKTTVPPTCTSQGYDEYTCKRDLCYYSYIDNYTNKLDHNYPEEGEVVQAIGCGITEILKFTCSDCGKVEYRKGETGAHDDVDSLEWDVIVPATCEGKGYQTKTCSQCLNVIASEEIPALTHDYKSEVVQPTCTAKGYTKQTCQRDGCGDVVYTDEVDATGHAWGEGVLTEATCTSGAYRTYTCGNGCGETKIEIVGNAQALAHNWVQTAKTEATCTEDGSVSYECSACKQTKTEIIPHIGHTWHEWEITQAATNSKDGEMKRTCSNNKCTETVVIPKGGHAWDGGTVIESATCTTEGTIVYDCTAHTGEKDCGITLEISIPVKQHTVGQKTNASTCTVQGSVVAYCLDCNKELNTQSIPVKAHSYTAGTPVAATCTTSGYTPYTCSCGDTYNKYDADKPALGHEFTSTETVVNAATCTDNGIKSVKCSRCAETEEKVIPRLGHNFAVDSTTAATCKDAATKTYKCQNANCTEAYTISEGTPTDSHDWNEWVTVEQATNESLGYKTRTCKVCDKLEVETIQSTGTHQFTVKDNENSKAPTCTEDGYDLMKCANPDHVNCTATSSIPVSKLGHTAVQQYTAPTCYSVGSVKTVCDTCKIDLIDSQEIPVTVHSYDEGEVTKEPTCTTEGVKTYTCTVEECKATRTEPVSKKGHDLVTTVNEASCTSAGSVVTTCNNGCNYNEKTALTQKDHSITVTVTPATCSQEGKVVEKCTKCSYENTVETIAKLAHSFTGTETETLAPTCTAEGSKDIKCAYCNETKTVSVPALGHDWGEWTVESASTNTEKGVMKRTCQRNGCEASETHEIPEGGHNLVVDAQNSTAASCKAEGKTVYKCDKHTDCGITLELSIPVKQHTVKTETKDATCTKEGYVKTLCSVCGDVFTNETTEKIAHVYTAGAPVEATCTTSGYTPYTCSCGESYNKYDADKPALGHNYKAEETTAAGCISEGLMTYTCENDSEHTYTQTIPAKGHTYKESSSTEASCTTVGTKVYTCDCGETYTEFVEAMKPHSYGAWQTVTAATADKNGIQKRECSCGDVEYAPIAPIGNHVFAEEITKAATCTEKGLKTFTCTVAEHGTCSANYTQEIPATGHQQTLVYNAPSCTSVGSTQIVCSVESCKKVIAEKEIPAKGHAYNSSSVTDATCEGEGTRTYTCACGATKSEIIPAKGHNLVTTVNDATCGATGSVVITCKNCTGYNETTTLDAKGHIWGATPTETVDAKCDTNGSITYGCENCDATDVVTVEKLGHNWSEWKVETASTNTEKGVMKRTCERDGCSAFETHEIPEGGHNLVVDAQNSTAASCKAEGETVYKCDKHADCGITLKVTLAKTQHTLVTTEKSATCEEEGNVTTKCEKCNTVTIVNTVPATGHSYSAAVTTPATCTSEGVMTYTCAHNTEHKYTVAIAKLQHNYVAGDAVEATCTTSGYTPYKCEDCASDYVIITAPAKRHTFVKEGSTSTCEQGGTMTLKCACGATITAEVPALGHDFSGEETTENATCTADGLKKVKCSRCEAVDETVIPKTGHNYEKQGDTVAATCTAPSTEAYKCKNCGDAYTKFIAAANGHNWSDSWAVVRQATENEHGVEKTTCTVCGEEQFRTTAPIGNHKFDVATVDPTCTKDGSKTYTCSVHTDCSANYKETIPATGHKQTLVYNAPSCTAAGSTQIICSVDTCKEVLATETIPAKGHAYNNVSVKDATCEEEGTITFTCSCGEKKTESIDAIGHLWNDGTVENATCNKAGKVTFECTRVNCNETKETTIPQNANAHQYSTVIIPATCETEGSVVTQCALCKAETTNETLPMLAHDWNNWVKVDATNSTDGSWTRTCKKNANHKETVIIPAGGHSFNTAAPSATTPATCEVEGTATFNCSAHSNCGVTITVKTGYGAHNYSTKKVDASCTSTGTVTTYCTVCEKDFAVVTLEKLQHVFENEGTTEPTCTSSGYTTFKCATCEESYQEIGDSAKGHTFVKESSTATCEQGGAMTLKCACGATMTADVPALGHNYVKIASTKATCAASATETYKCSRCTASYTISVGDKLTTHTYDENWTTVKEASATSIGYKTRECTVCGKLEVRTIDATGEHQFATGKVVESKPATCTANGYEIRECSQHTDCGQKATITLNATGHTEVTDEAKVADCTNSGLTSGKHCSTCNTVLVKQEVIPALGHLWNDGTVTAATCVKEGKIDYICTRCTATKTTVIPVSDVSHKLKTETTPSTCYKEGEVRVYCENNGCIYEMITTVSVKEHIWGTPTVKAATCVNDGIKIYNCTDENCGATKQEIIPKTGHKFTAGTPVDASCTRGGYTPYSCECGLSYNKYDESNPAKTHSYIQVENSSTATCEQGGTITLRCACGATITADVPALGHNYVKIASTEATCAAAATETYKCNNANCTAKAYTISVGTVTDKHNWGEGWVTAKEATSDSLGYRTRTCEVCLKTETEIIQSTGTHQFTVKDDENSKTPTCTEDGYDLMKCANPDHENCTATSVVPVSKLGHTEKLSYTAPTCTAKGSVKTVCDRCTAELTDPQEIPMVAHSYNNGIVTTEPTCTTEGIKTFTCSCGATRTEPVSKKGHTLSTAINDATCTEKGSVVTTCADCSYKYERELDIKPHSLNVTVTPATCTAEGSVLEKCTACTYEKTTAIEKLAHSFTGKETVINDATCTVEGSKTVQCANCTQTTTVKIPVTNHNFVPGEVVPASCTEGSYVMNTCVCGREYKEQLSGPKGHTWGEGTVTTNATCETDGEKTFTCACGATKKEVLPKTGHSWTEWETTKNPSATEEGEKTRYCLNGGCKETVSIPALGGGNITYTVTFVADGKEIAVVEVNHGNAAVAPAISKQSDEACHYSVIWDKDFSAVTENMTVTAIFVPADHVYGEWIVDVPSTCSKTGSQHRSCSCGYTQTQSVATSNHDYSIIEKTVNATCTESGYSIKVCAECGSKTTETILRYGHVMTYHEYVPETCDTDGVKAYYSCSRCGLNFADRLGKTQITSIVIGKRYHTYIIVDGMDATCTTDGKTEYRYCTYCGYTEIPQTIPALGHADTNGDSVCDRCSYYMENGEVICTCSCHKTGFFNELIYKILLFFWKLFGTNQTCECGKVHY